MRSYMNLAVLALAASAVSLALPTQYGWRHTLVEFKGRSFPMNSNSAVDLLRARSGNPNQKPALRINPNSFQSSGSQPSGSQSSGSQSSGSQSSGSVPPPPYSFSPPPYSERTPSGSSFTASSDSDHRDPLTPYYTAPTSPEVQDPAPAPAPATATATAHVDK